MNVNSCSRPPPPLDNVPTHAISSQRHAENVLNLTKIHVCKTVKALMAAIFFKIELRNTRLRKRKGREERKLTQISLELGAPSGLQKKFTMFHSFPESLTLTEVLGFK